MEEIRASRCGDRTVSGAGSDHVTGFVDAAVDESSLMIRHERTLHPRRRRHFVVAVLGVVVADAGIVVASSSSNPSSAGAAQMLRHALTLTIAADSLAFTLNEQVSADGANVNVRSNGECALPRDCAG